MAAKRDATCPLCGARLTPGEVLDACEEIADAALGALACRCPKCQGHFDVLPGAGRLELGYVRYGRFDAVVVLSAPGLEVLGDAASGRLYLHSDGKDWNFAG